MPKSEKKEEANLVVRGYKGFDKDLRRARRKRLSHQVHQIRDCGR